MSPPAAQFWWAVPLVGALGALVAVYSIIANRRIARMRATLDLIERTESSQYYLDIRKSFKRLELESDVPLRVSKQANEDDRNLRRLILAYLNHYELVAIGCKTGILDESFYAAWMRTALVRDWAVAKEVILNIRNAETNPVPNAFTGFEALARRFENERERGARMRRFSGRVRDFYRSRSLRRR